MVEIDFVEFWANKCKENMQKYQNKVNTILNSQIQIGNNFYKRIGRKKSLKIIKS